MAKAVALRLYIPLYALYNITLDNVLEQNEGKWKKRDLDQRTKHIRIQAAEKADSIYPKAIVADHSSDNSVGDWLGWCSQRFLSRQFSRRFGP